MEQGSQYHLGLWSVDGDNRSYGRPKKSLPRESFMSAVPCAPHALHEPASSIDHPQIILSRKVIAWWRENLTAPFFRMSTSERYDCFAGLRVFGSRV